MIGEGGWEISEKEAQFISSKVTFPWDSDCIITSWTAHHVAGHAVHTEPGQEEWGRGPSTSLLEGRKAYRLRVDTAFQLILLL